MGHAEGMNHSDDILVLEAGSGDRGKRLDRFIADRLGGVTRSKARKIVEGRLRGGPFKPGTRVRSGQRFELKLAIKNRREPDFPLELIHESDTYLVVDKPAGQLVHPPRRGVTNTLVDTLRERFGQEVSFPHRLDRETSGVMIAARNTGALRRFSEMFEKGRVEKTYQAVVQGRPDPPEGRIDLPVGPKEGSRVHDRQCVRPDGRLAVTVYRVLRTHGDRSLVELLPETGRLHQIRVHMAALGTPLVGDKIYGPDERFFLDVIENGFTEEMKKALILPRHALHAAALSFVCPETKESRTFTSSLPDDMATLLV